MVIGSKFFTPKTVGLKAEEATLGYGDIHGNYSEGKYQFKDLIGKAWTTKRMGRRGKRRRKMRAGTQNGR
jgi:hypothetical protein